MKPGQTSLEVQNKGISGPTNRTYGPFTPTIFSTIAWTLTFRLSNGWHCTVWVHSHLRFGQLLHGVKSSIMGYGLIFYDCVDWKVQAIVHVLKITGVNEALCHSNKRSSSAARIVLILGQVKNKDYFCWFYWQPFDTDLLQLPLSHNLRLS